MGQLVQIMRTLRSMPPLPNVAQRVLQIVRDPEYSIDSLVQVVRTDPALTARILKLCNSSLYSLRTPIASVSDAVSFIGTRNLVKLVIVSCTASYYKDVRSSRYADPAALWQHTLGCAMACQLLGETFGHEQGATAFTTGILHNVGKVALAQVVDDTALAELERLAAEHPETDYVALERQVLGLDHATAGGIVTESWNLPVELRRAVRNHHDAVAVAGEGELTALLHIADHLVLGLGIGNPIPGFSYHVLPEALNRLHLTAADLESVGARVIDELKRAADALNLDAVGGR